MYMIFTIIKIDIGPLGALNNALCTVILNLYTVNPTFQNTLFSSLGLYSFAARSKSSARYES